MGTLEIGIGAGSFTSGYLSGRQVEYGLVPLGALGLTVCTAVLAHPSLTTFGPVDIVPLNAIMQQRPDPQTKVSVISTAAVLSFTGGALGGQRDRLLGHGGDAAPVDIVHREDMHAGVEHLLLLGRVEVADADEDGLGRGDRWREVADPQQLGWLRTEQRRQRHPMHVAARRGGWSVHVAVGIDPDEADPLAPALGVCRGGGDRSGGQAVVATQREWQCVRLKRGQRGLKQPVADTRDLPDVLLALVPTRLRFLDLGREVASVDNPEAKRGEPIAKPVIRRADGPISTPRRPAQRSRGTPMMWTVRMSGVLHPPMFRRGRAGGTAVRHTVGDPHPAESGPGEMESV